MVEKKLRLVAIANKWHMGEAEEEIGDSLYVYDRDCLEIRVDPVYPLIYVYSCLDIDKVFTYIVSEPPAYVERIVPAQIMCKYTIVLKRESLLNYENALSCIKYSLKPECRKKCYIEVHPRNFYMIYRNVFPKKTAQKHFQKIISFLLNIRIDRKAKYSLILEDTREGIIGAILPRGSDRLRYWRERRLSLDTRGEKVQKRNT